MEGEKSKSNTGLLIVASFFVVALIVVAVVALIDFLEPPQDESIQASYKSLAKKEKLSSPFPEQISASFRRLSDRYAINGPATNDDLKKLCRQQQVDSLQLEYTEITADGFETLTHEPISRLIIAGQDIEIPEAKAISKMKGLTRLEIANSKKTGDHVIACLKDLPELKMITIRHCGITDSGVAMLAKNFPTVEAFDIMDNKVSDRSVGSIKSLPALNSLNISCTDVTSDGVRSLMTPDFIGSFHGTDLGINDHAVEQIARSHCWSLNISGSPITDKSLRLLTGIKGLQYLYVAQCPLLTNAGISYFKEKSPDCKLELVKGYQKRAEP